MKESTLAGTRGYPQLKKSKIVGGTCAIVNGDRMTLFDFIMEKAEGIFDGDGRNMGEFSPLPSEPLYDPMWFDGVPMEGSQFPMPKFNEDINREFPNVVALCEFVNRNCVGDRVDEWLVLPVHMVTLLRHVIKKCSDNRCWLVNGAHLIFQEDVPTNEP